MLLFRRPPQPQDFDQNVERYRQETEAAILDNKKPDFPNAWGSYKGHFALAQHGKCGYCEMRVIGSSFGDVEHFRPKGEVWTLFDDPETWGRERLGLSNVEGRQRRVLSTSGYWWLAYAWENYLLACPICNQSWKLSYFPVEEEDRCLPPSRDTEEHPLLLNPFDGPDPAQHLCFGAQGEVQARDGSLLGRETIKTYGLDRDSLRLARLEKARKAHHLVLEILGTDSDDDLDRALAGFHELGRVEFDHAGMVRVIFEQECGVSWQDLETIVEGESP